MVSLECESCLDGRSVDGEWEDCFDGWRVQSAKGALMDCQLMGSGRTALVGGEFRVRKLPCWTVS